jgi:hypothetical protein
MTNDSNFKFIIPAELEKSANGDWKVRGLASTNNLDRQGERILQEGLDLTPIDQKRGVINYDHLSGPENTIGLLDGYTQTNKGLYIEGRLFKNHTKAKAIYEIMSSLNKADHGRMGISVEGKIIERDPLNPSVIKKCRINAVALTLNPVNVDTYVDIVKSMNASQTVEFNSIEQAQNLEVKSEEPMFTSTQVVSIIEKALAITTGNALAPNTRTGGDALGQEELDSKKKLKNKPKELFKSQMLELLDQLQSLHPDCSRSELWAAISERLSTKFPQIHNN